MSDKKTDKPSWLFNQSAVIPYRFNDDCYEILLITTIKKKHWIIPKGVIDPGLSPTESAVKEAREEAGIEGRIVSKCLGTYSYKKWGGTCHVEVYLFEVDNMLDQWPEKDLRKRQWFSVKKAVSTLREDTLKKIIKHTFKKSGA